MDTFVVDFRGVTKNLLDKPMTVDIDLCNSRSKVYCPIPFGDLFFQTVSRNVI